MSITRISEFQADEGVIEDLREFLVSIMQTIKSSKGCESVKLYQNQDDSSKFIMLEVWDTIQSHQASVRNIPPEKLSEVRPLLAASPRGSYYKLIHQEK